MRTYCFSAITAYFDDDEKTMRRKSLKHNWNFLLTQCLLKSFHSLKYMQLNYISSVHQIQSYQNAASVLSPWNRQRQACPQLTHAVHGYLSLQDLITLIPFTFIILHYILIHTSYSYKY